MKRDSDVFRVWIDLRELSLSTGVPFFDGWMIFYEFKEWYLNNAIQGYYLDKKMAVSLGSISPSTCFFAPMKIISLFFNKKKNRPLPVGVYTNPLGNPNNPYRVMSYSDGKRKHIGVYSSIEAASEAYKKHRVDYMLDVVNSFSDVLSGDVLELYKDKCLTHY